MRPFRQSGFGCVVAQAVFMTGESRVWTSEGVVRVNRLRFIDRAVSLIQGGAGNGGAGQSAGNKTGATIISLLEVNQRNVRLAGDAASRVTSDHVEVA